MKMLYILVLGAVVSACNSVDFYQLQPLNGERLNSIPAEFQGIWKSSDGEECLQYAAEYIRHEEVHLDSLGTLSDTTVELLYLSDSLQLFKGDKYLVFNARNLEGTWNIVVQRLEKGGAIGVYYCDDYEVYGKMKGLSMDSVYVSTLNYEPGSEEPIYTDTVLYRPTLKQLGMLEEGKVYTVRMKGQIRSKDLKKVCKEEHLLFRLQPDGLIYYQPWGVGDEL